MKQNKLNTLENNGIIFGVSSVIGLELAKELTKRGANLILQDDSKSNLEKINFQLKKISKQQIYLHCKHQIPENLDNLNIAIQQQFKKLDFIISTIGKIESLRPLTDLSLKEWKKSIDVNLTTNWIILKNSEFFLRQSRSPKIYFFYNSEISKGAPYYNSYSISKAALKSMVDLYQKEKKRFNFTVKIIDIELDKFCEISHLRPKYKKYNYNKEVKMIVSEILKI